ncbi:IS3 family transposase [Adhaeribacter rhizoryzae]|uniref:IS3 family transposase n=1 Tax=Adhaeribacter rhizoryzae TaxID=2607907 RepID=A0A5M6CVZ2_9BACT|nr:IS3 family transposase [Adhaeribacter rhizoryzae]KAA5539116.1 IS3 family transposase [Adhaeribacter rhizoryzae]
MGLGKLCGLFGKSRQAYYQQLCQQEKNDKQQMLILAQVIKIRQQLPGVGTGKLHHLLTDFLAEQQIKLGRDKLYDLLRENHLLRSKRRRRAKTTNSQHPFYKYANLIKELPVSYPNQLWVSDITYIRTGNDFSYLSLITDAYSHQIMGWALDTTLQTKGPLTTWQMAVKSLQKGKESLIHHSDRGIQYCSKEYIQLLCTNNICISMTNQGEPGENALAERINRTIKDEFNCRAFLSFDLAKAAITKSILAYNQLRPHASCDYLKPAQAHQQDGPLKKRWRKYEKKTLPIPTS